MQAGGRVYIATNKAKGPSMIIGLVLLYIVGKSILVDRRFRESSG
jgi:hypothetical protein